MSITLPPSGTTTRDVQGEGAVLSVALEGEGASCVLRLRGVLRANSIAALETQIDQLGCISCQEVSVDLAELKAIDCVGVKVLNGLHQYVLGRGGHFELVGGHGQVAEALHAEPW